MASDERVAVVTGGGRGIGRGNVAELAGIGYSVVVNYRSDADSAGEACRLARARRAPRAIALGPTSRTWVNPAGSWARPSRRSGVWTSG